MAEQVKAPASPEHEKLEARKAEHEVITSFLDWLEGQEYHIGKWDFDDHDSADFAPLVAEYLDIDYDAYYAEKDAMLAHIREVQGL